MISSTGGGVLSLDLALPAPGNLSARAVIAILGGSGQGKTTALEHAAALLAADARILYLDEPDGRELMQACSRGPVIYTAPALLGDADLTLRLAPWGDDELIELALSRPAPAREALGRLLAMEDRDVILTRPEMACAVLDALAATPDEGTPGAVMTAFNLLARELSSQGVDQLLALAFHHATRQPAEALRVRRGPRWADAFLGHPSTIGLLAAVYAVSALQRGPEPVLARSWPDDLRSRTARTLAASPGLRRTLEDLLARGAADAAPTAVSLLAEAFPGWRPDPNGKPLTNLSHAHLPGVCWAGALLRGVDASEARLPRADLAGADLTGANLSHADLRDARLAGAELPQADLSRARASRANFSEANLAEVKSSDADFEDADLSRADLTRTVWLSSVLRGARLVRANLRDAHLTRLDVEDADFSGAVLSGASLNGLDLRAVRLVGAGFHGAVLRSCRLDGQVLEAADFSDAALVDCDLTATVLRNADLRGAALTCCGLAHVDWEGADLRRAAFRGCSFHAGSSRSGLVFSPIASEGSRTGFYTDESATETYKDPEEIRKANLGRCDLRGADLGRVDFYLVDLRGARYSAEQESWLRACGAILR